MENIYTKKELLGQLDSPESLFFKNLNDNYSDSLDSKSKTKLVNKKANFIKNLLLRDELIFDKATIITRCPGRISFSKHADYVNNDLIYCTDDREIFLAFQLVDNNDLALEHSSVLLCNQSDSFENESFLLKDLMNYKLSKNSWTFYPLKLLQMLLFEDFFELNLNIENLFKNKSIILAYSSDLAAGGGLSSSHALMLSTLFAFKHYFLSLKDSRLHDLSLKKPLEILGFCQKIEHDRGFKSGLGDQAAQLLSKKDHLLFIKLLPEIKLSYMPKPKEMGIITAPSFIKADKSLPEFKEANYNIEVYKQVNKALGVAGAGDLLYEYSDEEILTKLEEIEDSRLRSLALYALAEGARAKDLKEHLSDKYSDENYDQHFLEKLGHYLNLSHAAERLNMAGHLGDIDKTRALAEHIGYYGASTKVNDELQTLANSLDEVYGSSISGAGLGGNNIVLCHYDALEKVQEALFTEFYSNQNLPGLAVEMIHISSSSNPVSRLI